MNNIFYSVIVSIIFLYFMTLGLNQTGQKRKFKFSISVDYADFNNLLVENYTWEAPFDGWITNCTWELEYESFSHDAGIGLMVGKGEDWGEVNDSNPMHVQIMAPWGNGASDTVSHASFDSAPIYHYLRAEADGETVGRKRVKRTKNLYIQVEQGDNINVHSFASALGNTLTSGTVEARVIFDFHVGTWMYGGSEERRSTRGSEEVILFDITSTGGKTSFWVAPCNGRISNIRMTSFSEMGIDYGYLYFGRRLYTDAKPNMDQIYGFTDGVFLLPYQHTAGDTAVYEGATVYKQKNVFVKRDEFIQLHGQVSVETIGMVEFDFTPEYGAKGHKVVKWNIDNLTVSNHFRITSLPYDVFLEDIEIDVRVNGTVEGELYVSIYKDLPEILSDLAVNSGAMLESSVVDDNISRTLPPNIKETISLPWNDESGVRAEIYDYFRAGGLVGWSLYPEVADGTPDIEVIFDINWESRVRSNRMGINYFQSDVFLEQGYE